MTATAAAAAVPATRARRRPDRGAVTVRHVAVTAAAAGRRNCDSQRPDHILKIRDRRRHSARAGPRLRPVSVFRPGPGTVRAADRDWVKPPPRRPATAARRAAAAACVH